MWAMFGPCLGHVGQCVGHMWAIFGPCLGHVWAMFEPCLGNVWSMSGPCLGHVWAMFGPCLGHVWAMFGPCLGNVWTMFGPGGLTYMCWCIDSNSYYWDTAMSIFSSNTGIWGMPIFPINIYKFRPCQFSLYRNMGI
jgi:hypothetical protein